MFDSRFKMKEKGYTLVELMTVIVIIGILVVIAVPVYSDVSANSREKADLANIRAIEDSIETYLAENSGKYSNLTLAADGAIGGTGVTVGNLVPDYLTEMPKYPFDDTRSYTKAASANVVPQP